MEQEKRIPKIIHYCWFGKSPLPEKANRCIESWKKFCPDYEIKEWNESNYDVNSCNFTRDAYNNKKWAFVTDYARLDIIYNYGGIYLDTDVEIVKSLDSLLDCNCFMGFEGESHIATGLGFGATKYNKVISDNIKEYQNIKFENNDEFLESIACPKITSRLLEEKYGVLMNNSLQILEDITVYPNDYFCPKDPVTGIINITSNTFSIHHYDGSWVSQEKKKYKAIKNKLYTKYGDVIGELLFNTVFIPERIYLKIKRFGIKKTLTKIRNRLLKNNDWSKNGNNIL